MTVAREGVRYTALWSNARWDGLMHVMNIDGMLDYNNNLPKNIDRRRACCVLELELKLDVVVNVRESKQAVSMAIKTRDNLQWSLQWCLHLAGSSKVWPIPSSIIIHLPWGCLHLTPYLGRRAVRKK